MTHAPFDSSTGFRPHLPVMLAEVLDALSPVDGEVYVDGTFGAGGYSGAILNAANCRVIAIDRDPDAVVRARPFQDRYPDRFTFLSGCFSQTEDLLGDIGVTQVNGIVLDIGVSSMQIDQADRGFSFRDNGPLDMRMSQAGPSAMDLVNTLDEEDLANLIYRFGEERASRKIAHAIVTRRTDTPFQDTRSLAETVRSVVRKSKDGIDPATRTFQALRIAVNDELGELDRILAASERLIVPDGRLVVVSFHSLEDRIVKSFLRDRSGTGASGSRHLPAALCAGTSPDTPTFSISERRARSASDTESRANPRARSAKLRSAFRTQAPARPDLMSRKATS